MKSTVKNFQSTFLITIVFLIIFSCQLFTQSDYRIVRPELNDQISNNYIYCIHQDNFGFIWFGTDRGLMKHDGYNITVFVNDPDNPQSLSNNKILTIYEDPLDSGKILWLGTSEGLVKFDRTTGVFYNLTEGNDNVPSLANETIQAIYKDRYGNYWIGGKGFAKFDRNRNMFSYHLDKIKQLFVYSICEGKSGVLWLGTNFGLVKYEPQATIDINYSIFPLNKGKIYKTNRNMISSVLEDKKGVLWVGAYEGIFIFNKETENFSQPQFKVGKLNSFLVFTGTSSSNLFIDLLEDKKGNIWGGSRALSKINSSRDTLTWYKQFSVLEDSSLATRISALCIDKSGIIWVGLSNLGLIKCIPNLTKFYHYKHIPSDEYSLLNNSVTSFAEDSLGNIWIGLRYGGVNKFDKESNKFLIGGLSPVANSLSISPSHILWSSNIAALSAYDINTEYEMTHFTNGATSGPTKFEISQDQKFNINQRVILQKSTGSAKLISRRDYSNGIFYCYVDKKGIIWNLQGPGRTIYQYNEAKTEYIPYQVFLDEDISNSIQMLFEDSEGILWFGTNGKGLVKRIKNDKKGQNYNKDSFYLYKNEPNNNNSLSNNHVNTICEDREGNLWIGTDVGLNKFNKKNEIFSRYGVKSGLPSDYIAGIVEDDHGLIWVSTNRGLSRLDPISESIKNFDKSSGLQSNVFNDRCCLKDSHGIIYFGGPNGFNMFKPEEIKENPNLPKIMITGFQIFNKPVKIGIDSPLNKSIEFSDELILKHDQNVITFEFSALEYTNPENNLYQYKMEGVDPSWVSTNSNRRFASYTQLSPGNYNFYVRGSNNDGIWSTNEALINVIILHPWWQTNWAYFLYTLIIAGVFYFIWRIRINRLHLEHQAEINQLNAEKFQEMDRMKSRFFANISHEFRTPLTLIIGIVNKIKKQLNDGKNKEELNTVSRYAVKLNNLVDQLLDLSKLESGKMELELTDINLVPLLRGIVSSFSSLSETKNITLHFYSSLQTAFVKIDPYQFEKIINNLLMNSLKFTQKGGSIEVELKELDAEIAISISDTGIGIPEERIEKIFDRFYQADDSQTREFEGTGIGLALTKELVELHGGNILVESKEGKGTKFIIHLPFNRVNQSVTNKRTVKLIQDNNFDQQDHDQIPNSQNKEPIELELISENEKPILLLVEDNYDVRQYVKGFFEKDYILVQAKNGIEGFSKAVEIIPDIIISDVMMPKMDGFHLLEKLKTDERTNHISVVLLTAKASDQDKIEGLEIGADDYMMKPFDAEELRVRVKNLVVQRRRIREHFKKQGIINFNDENIDSANKIFLQKALKIIENYISETKFGVEQFSNEMAMSRQQLRRKFMSIIGESPSDFIRRVRLTRAKKLIEQNFGNISEIAYEVGFDNPAYFTQSFKKHFEISPSQFEQKNKN